jgi:hypothetical protein
MGGMKRQMDTQGGAARANHILNKYGSPSVLDGIDDLFAAKAAEKTADPRLGGLLGDAGVSAASTLAGKFKLDQGTIMKVIVMLAPIVLGFLSRKRDQGGWGQEAWRDRPEWGRQHLDDVAGFLRGGAGAGGRPRGGLLGGWGPSRNPATRPCAAGFAPASGSCCWRCCSSGPEGCWAAPRGRCWPS